MSPRITWELVKHADLRVPLQRVWMCEQYSGGVLGSSIDPIFRNTVTDSKVCLLSIASPFGSGHHVFLQSHFEPAFYAVTQGFSAMALLIF